MNALLHILQHALGVDQYGQGEQYRDHFVTGEGSVDHSHCMEAVERGLMTRRLGSPLTGGDDLFLVTEAGRQWMTQNSPPAPPAPKLTRSQRRYRNWIDSGAADCGVSFGEFIRRPA